MTTTDTPARAAAILRQAAEFVRHHHCKGAYAMIGDKDVGLAGCKDAESCCAWGAIIRFSPSRMVESWATRAMVRLVGRHITQWNDAPERTSLEVADTMMRAANTLEAKP